VVVWVVVATFVTNSVAPGVGMQSPIFFSRLMLVESAGSSRGLVQEHIALLHALSLASRLSSALGNRTRNAAQSPHPPSGPTSNASPYSRAHHGYHNQDPTSLESSFFAGQSWTCPKVDKAKYICGKYTRSRSESRTREIGCGQAHLVWVYSPPNSLRVSGSVRRKPSNVVSKFVNP